VDVAFETGQSRKREVAVRAADRKEKITVRKIGGDCERDLSIVVEACPTECEG
jgi:hypothetical protein